MEPDMKNRKEDLRQLLINNALKFNLGIRSNKKPYHWILDCREICLSPSGAYLAASLLFEKVKKYNCTQIGGIAIGADPIVGAMVLYGFLNNHPLSGFIIRKQAKAYGLQKVIEGDFKPGEPVILVDDIVNSGESIFYAVDLLKSMGCEICAVVSIINFKRKGYKRLRENNIPVEYIFDLKDLYIENRPLIQETPNSALRWRLNDINMWPVTIPRSTPALHGDNLLFGTNEGVFLCIDKNDGLVQWRKDLGIKNPKGILSSPCIDGDRVYFGAYNGYLYCLDANDGLEIWKTNNCSWIGSSPCMDRTKIYIGIEYNDNGESSHADPKLEIQNAWQDIGPLENNERGGLCAYSKDNGQPLWHLETGHYIHSSPCIDTVRNIVVVGCNDGYIYAADSQSGRLCWKFKTGFPTRAGFVIDQDMGCVYFGSENGVIYCMAVKSGRLNWARRIGARIYNTPEIKKDFVIISTVSQRIFALDKSNGRIHWFYNTKNLIFGSTKTTDDHVYCGDNGGYLHVIDIKNGELIEKYDTGNEILTKPVVEHGTAYLGCKGAFVRIDFFQN